MKKVQLFLGLLIISLLTSCAVPQKPYYQVYKAEGIGKLNPPTLSIYHI